jgi:hypothetical protein
MRVEGLGSRVDGNQVVLEDGKEIQTLLGCHLRFFYMI